MKINFKYVVAVIAIVVASKLAAQPTLYLQDAKRIAAIKSNAKKNKATQDNIVQLSKEADKMLKKEYGSVMDKTQTPPCGNKHEYMSLAKYFWPDPSKPDGKPYIRKDGQRNPECDSIKDDANFDAIIKAINVLSWAYYFTDEEKYADKAVSLINLWFLDEASYMAPNLNHAQYTTGLDTGRGSGIIDTHDLPWLLDNIGILRSSKYWNKKYEAGMKQWFNDYLTWMQTSKNGIHEGKTKNNHKVFYDNQIAAIALFCGKDDVAKKVFENATSLITHQVEPDGRQPEELVRTLSLHYSTFNLQAWFSLANIAEKKGVDLWHFETSDGRSIKKALDYLLPYATKEKQWEGKQIKPFDPKTYYSLLLQAAIKYKDENYKVAAEKIKDSNKNVLVKLFYE